MMMNVEGNDSSRKSLLYVLYVQTHIHSLTPKHNTKHTQQLNNQGNGKQPPYHP